MSDESFACSWTVRRLGQLLGRTWGAVQGAATIGVLVGLLGAEAQAQPTPGSGDERVQQHIERMAHERPPDAALERLQRYESYIRYATSLSFLRPNVTVNANFVRALIAAESAAQPDAVSSEGAVGLMQILPSTGRKAARELYETGYEFEHVARHRLQDLRRSDLKDPAINILIGCYLLDRYNLEFGNNLVYTVGAWNAGPGKIRQHQGAPPYAETQELIGRVNAYYLFFREHGYSD